MRNCYVNIRESQPSKPNEKAISINLHYPPLATSETQSEARFQQNPNRSITLPPRRVNENAIETRTRTSSKGTMSNRQGIRLNRQEDGSTQQDIRSNRQ